MAPRKHTRRRNRSRPSAAVSKAASAATFRMVVATQPGSGLSIRPELELVKAALLYGDEVTLLSPVTTMLLGAEALEHFPVRVQIELSRRVAPYLMGADQVVEFQDGLDRLSEFLQVKGPRGGGAAVVQAQIRQRLGTVLGKISEVTRSLGQEAGLDALAGARSRGLLRIENANPARSIDLLVHCIAAAKLAKVGRRPESSFAEDVVEAFTARLSDHLTSGREYLIFDEQVASLTRAAIREGLFSPAPGPSGRCAQAMTASALMARLPTFPDASVDEVLDIRRDLAAPLTQFRGAMVTVSSGMTTRAWEADFDDCVHDAWVEHVHPAIQAIEASVADNRSLLDLAADTVSAASRSLPGLALLGAGILGHADSLADGRQHIVYLQPTAHRLPGVTR